MQQEVSRNMVKAIKMSVAMLILFALVALTMLGNVYAEKAPVYADAFGEVIPPQLLVKVFNWSRLPPNTSDLSTYREFAKRFYKTCSVNVDMVLLLIYAIEVEYKGYPHEIGYALLYDPLTGNFLWGFLNRSDASIFFDWAYQHYYDASKKFPPAGFYFWYLVVDEYAWRYNHSLVARAWFFRYNATHLKNPDTRYNGFPLDIYCPISDNFTWSMLFKGLPQTVTVTYTMPVTITLPVTVTETSTLTTTLPVTITSTATATSTTTIERTVTTPTTIRETVTHVETLTVKKTATTTMSYTLTLPVTTTVMETATTTAVETTTHVVKELDITSLMVATGLAIAIGIAIGFMAGRR